MSRIIVRRPALGPEFDAWARSVEAQLAALPNFSVISTASGPNASGLTGSLGDLAVDVGSAATHLWQKTDGSSITQGWSAFSWI